MINVQENILLASLTTFKIGGKARYFVEVKDEKEIKEALEWAKDNNINFHILAGGSNVLIPDEGIDDLIIHIIEGHIEYNNNELVVDPGCNLLNLIKESSRVGLGGWEKLAGIPGTIGGALRGNAGAFGVEIKDFVKSVRAINVKSGYIKSFDYKECEFSYRNSFFKNNTEWIIVEVVIALYKVDIETSDILINETISEREKRHLQNVKAAGSFFMNPIAPIEIIEMFEIEKEVKSKEGRVPAGWLIDKAGMRGERVGGAIASTMHPNYLVNTGSATSVDVKKLASVIKDKVKEKFGVELKEEAMIF